MAEIPISTQIKFVEAEIELIHQQRSELPSKGNCGGSNQISCWRGIDASQLELNNKLFPLEASLRLLKLQEEEEPVTRPESRDDAVGTDATNRTLADTSSFLDGITEKLSGYVKNPLAIGVVVLGIGAVIYSKKSRTSKR